MAKGTYITAYKKIDGKRYHLRKIHTSKSEADKQAKRIRSTETSVRVITMPHSQARLGGVTRLHYVIYVR